MLIFSGDSGSKLVRSSPHSGRLGKHPKSSKHLQGVPEATRKYQMIRLNTGNYTSKYLWPSPYFS